MNIIVPSGFFGASADDNSIDTLLRAIGKKFGEDCDWPEKYGCNIKNDSFSMHQYCWCESEACEYCREVDPEPNFHHKKTGLKVWWYKYIGRSQKQNIDISDSELRDIYAEIMEANP